MLHNFIHVAYAMSIFHTPFFPVLFKIKDKILTEAIPDKIWGFHGSEDSYCGLLGYDTV
jgi:hypothetical protein